MKNYIPYKKVYSDKTDAQIIESLALELADKVETIHRLLKEKEDLRLQFSSGQSIQLRALFKKHYDATGYDWMTLENALQYSQEIISKKDLEYYRENAEEDYLNTPISVLAYISKNGRKIYSES